MIPTIRRWIAGGAGAAAFLAVALAPAHAQQATTTGAVRGVVTGDNGTPITAATVIATEVETGVRRGVQTDAQGRYQIPFLNPGRYVVRAQMIGYRPVERPAVRIGLGQVERLIQLAWADLEEARRYLLLIPRRAVSIRLFCILPLLFAYATLRDLAQSSAMLRPGGTVKIHRREVKALLMTGALFVMSNRAVRWLVARVRRREFRLVWQ